MLDVNPCFSEDIWFEILKNIPVKTLGKCRCVCKSWHSLIVSPFFMASHLKHYTQNDTNSLLLYRDILDTSREHEQYSFFLDAGRVPLERCHTSIWPFKLDDGKKQCSYVVGSIHGLLCLSDKAYLDPTTQIMLWNPFLRKIINLPVSMIATSDMDDLTSVLGFGYDSNKNDHVVVVKISISGVEHRFNLLVEVYSLSKRIWKIIPANYLTDNSICRVSYSHVFLNGIIHWLACETGPFHYLVKWVLLFNVVEKTFEKIEFPEALVKDRSLTISLPCLFKYKTKLSVFHCKNTQRGRFVFANCQIWVKEELSWCMIFRISVDVYDLIYPLEYLGKNGKLFGFDRKSDGMLVCYDVANRQFIELGFYRYLCSKFAAFTDSLVLLDQDTDVNSDDELQRYIHSST